LVAFCAVAANANSDWVDLRGSFLIAKQESFAKFPRTIREPLFTNESWVPTSSTPNDCTNGGKFAGIQHVRENDYSVGLLYDVKGVIAGIQLLIPQDVVVNENNTLRYADVPAYGTATYNGRDYFVITAYFVEPSTICSTGREDSELAQGTGTGLWIQNGTNVFQVPRERPTGDAAVESKWTENNCFPAMGSHNFYNVPEYTPTQCNQMVPIFGLYNRQNKLHGFGFITVGFVDNPRFEHPPQTAIKMILGETPQCVLDIEERIGITSLHVYFVDRPYLITCSIFRAIGSYFSGMGRWLRSLG
jgi:charged multivesicular body protein 7